MTRAARRPRRILIVARLYPAHDHPGRGSFVADQAAALRAAGHEVAVICPQPAPASGLDGADGPSRLADFERWVGAVARGLPFAAPQGWGAPGVPVLRLPTLLPIGGEPTRHPADLGELATRSLVPVGLALAGRWPFDVIHLHNGLPDGIAARALADRLGLPLVVTEHDSTLREWMDDPRARAAYAPLLEPGSRVVAVSGSLAAVVAGVAGAPVERVGVVPNVVPVEGFAAAAAADRDPDELLWVGARKLSKGAETLLRAAAVCRSTRPSLRLRMVGRPGTDDEEARLLALAAELGLADAASFEPATDRAGVAAAMARAAVLVHASPWETFGIVAAEAVATGLPVAATPSGGVEEIVGRDGAFGVIAADQSPDALAAAIGQVLERRGSFDPEGMHAAMALRFGAGRVVAQLEAAYDAASADRAGVKGGSGGERDRAAAGNASTVAAGQPGARDAARSTAATDLVAPAVPSTAPPVVIGLRRPATLERLRSLPEALAAELTAVTLPARAGVAPDVATGTATAVRLVEADGEGVYDERIRAAGGPLRPARALRRLARAVRHPFRARRLRGLLRQRAAIIRAEQHRVILGALPGAVSVEPGTRREVLVLDVDDLAIVRDLLDRDVRLAPLTLGGFVDRWGSA